MNAVDQQAFDEEGDNDRSRSDQRDKRECRRFEHKVQDEGERGERVKDLVVPFSSSAMLGDDERRGS
jgi:hypothetical protein